MKRYLVAGAIVLASFTAHAADTTKQADPFANDTERISYVLGMDLGGYLKTMDMDLDLDVFYKGLQATYKGGTPLVSPEEAEKIKQEFAQKRQAEEQKKQAAEAKANRDKAAAFLAENKKKDGITETGSGLQYEVLQEGKGEAPGPKDQVTVNYRGTLMDGTEFDSSYKRGKPATFPLDQVIAGWTEGLQLMKPGAKYRFYVPADLAYGDRGAPPVIPPGSMLIFDVELLSVDKAGKDGAAR